MFPLTREWIMINGLRKHGSRRIEQSFDNFVTLFERDAEFLRLTAAALCHVGLATAAAAHDWRKLFDHLSRWNSSS